jgi:molecular chaperone GrpE
LTESKSNGVHAETPETQETPSQTEETPPQAQRKPRKQSLKERLKAAEEKAEENYERLLRMTADLENYKKRSSKEMDDLRKFANESIVKEILPIVDNLERALATPYEQNEEAFNAMRTGVEMTLKGLLDSLKTFGVVPVESLEQPFDPHFHQAVYQEESDKYPENTVSQELQKGYMLRERLLRPAMVVVSKKPDAKGDERSEDLKDNSKIKVTIQ